MQPNENVETQSEWELDLTKLEPQEHSFIQQGGFYVCQTPGHHHASYVNPLTIKDS